MMRGYAIVVLAVAVVACVVGVIGTLIAIDDLNRGRPGLFIAFVFLDAIGFGLVALGIWMFKRAKVQESEKRAADPVLAPYPLNAVVEHELDGFTYTTKYVPPVKGKNARPSTFTIETPCDCKYEFEMVVESKFDKFCKRLGIAVEVQTGDEKFDDECYIRSDYPAFASAYLADAVKRIAILDLRHLGFLSVALKNGRLTVQWIGFDPKTHHRDELAVDVAARLLLLARDLPAHEPEFDFRAGKFRTPIQVVLWAALVGFGVTIFSLLAYTPTHTADLLLRAAPVLLVGWPAFAVAAALMLRGNSRSHIAWGRVMLGALPLIPVGSAGSVGLLNGWLDGSAAETRKAVIVEKYTTRSKNTTKYHVRVQSWRNPADTESFQIGSFEYEKVIPHQSKMSIVTRAGGLGIEWIQSKSVENPPAIIPPRPQPARRNPRGPRRRRRSRGPRTAP